MTHDVPGTVPFTRRGFLAGAAMATLSATSRPKAGEELEPPILATDRKVRIGVVGGGFGAAYHWHQHPNCIVQAVSDLRSDRRAHLMRTYRCERAYDSLEELILDKEVDAVAVFTGAPDHVRHAVLCMEAGKHVISAVPAAMTLDDCQKLKETKERTGLRYMMAETSYYQHFTIAARKLYLDGKFGDIFYSEVEYYHPLNEAERQSLWFFEGKRTWRYGYPPMLYPTHSTGFLVGITRERIERVSCVGYAPGDDPALADNAYGNPFVSQAALMTTNRGHACRCNVGWVGTAHGERAQLFGRKLTYYWPGSGGQPFAMTGSEAPAWQGLPDFWHMVPKDMRQDSGHGGSHPFLTHEFVSALAEDREPAIDLYESLAMTAPGIVAHESAFKGGEQLKVPSFDRT